MCTNKSSWIMPLALAAILAITAASCAADDSSGLATLESVTTTTAGESLTAADADGPAAAAPATTEASADDGEDEGQGGNANNNVSDDLTDEERLLSFAACMRDNGVDFPDPVVEADGTIAFGRRFGQGGADQDGENLSQIGRDPDLPAARAACGGLIEGLALGPGGQNFDEVQIELFDRLLEFAQCMRDNGVDIADPDPNAFGRGGGGPGAGGPFGGIDLDDADVSAAFELCSENLPTAGRFGGRQ